MCQVEEGCGHALWRFGGSGAGCDYASVNPDPGSRQRVFCRWGQHLQSVAQYCQWWEKKETGTYGFVTGFPGIWLPTCAVIPLEEVWSSPFQQWEENWAPRISLPEGHAYGRASVALGRHASLHRDNVGLPGRGQRLWLLYAGCGGVSSTGIPPTEKWRISLWYFQKCFSSSAFSFYCTAQKRVIFR